MYAQKWIIYYVFYRRGIFKGLTGGALSTEQTPSLGSSHHNNNNSRFLVSVLLWSALISCGGRVSVGERRSFGFRSSFFGSSTERACGCCVADLLLLFFFGGTRLVLCAVYSRRWGSSFFSFASYLIRLNIPLFSRCFCSSCLGTVGVCMALSLTCSVRRKHAVKAMKLCSQRCVLMHR